MPGPPQGAVGLPSDQPAAAVAAGAQESAVRVMVPAMVTVTARRMLQALLSASVTARRPHQQGQEPGATWRITAHKTTSVSSRYGYLGDCRRIMRISPAEGEPEGRAAASQELR